jgi:hypothetical protein
MKQIAIQFVDPSPTSYFAAPCDATATSSP